VDDGDDFDFLVVYYCGMDFAAQLSDAGFA